MNDRTRNRPPLKVVGDWNGPGGPTYTGGNEPPSGDDMEARVRALETAIPDIRERLVRVETKLDSLERTGATKSDLDAMKGAVSAEIHKAIGEQTWKFITVSCVLAGIAFTAARFIPGG